MNFVPKQIAVLSNPLKSKRILESWPYVLLWRRGQGNRRRARGSHRLYREHESFISVGNDTVEGGDGSDAEIKEVAVNGRPTSDCARARTSKRVGINVREYQPE